VPPLNLSTRAEIQASRRGVVDLTSQTARAIRRGDHRTSAAVMRGGDLVDFRRYRL
jgi:hypothetical protein